jgi:uncharacterized protein
MKVIRDGEIISYQSDRNGLKGEFRFKGIYQPVSDVFYAKYGSLEYWLTERYCLYTEKHNHLYIGEIHHDPWPLQLAKAEIYENTMININGFSTSHINPMLHFAKRLDVLLWGIEKV